MNLGACYKERQKIDKAILHTEMAIELDNKLEHCYLNLATIMSGYYILISYKLLKEKNSTKEKRLASKLFGYSILYLFMIFVFILADKII